MTGAARAQSSSGYTLGACLRLHAINEEIWPRALAGRFGDAFAGTYYAD
jgi:hypothetical protein